MGDVAFLGLAIAILAGAVLYVAACGRIIGPAEDLGGDDHTGDYQTGGEP